MAKYDLLIKAATCRLPSGLTTTDIGVENGKITFIGSAAAETATKVIDAKGLHVLPGIIDTQVHFRDPGMEHKEDIESGSRGAVLGGITAFFDMPNTKPTTTTREALQDKIKRAMGRSWCDFAFYIGATTENLNDLLELESLPGVCGVKVFMGSSTGTLLVPDDAHLEKLLASVRRRVAVHAEDETRLKERKALIPSNATPEYHPVWRDEQVALFAVERIVRLAEKYQRRIHVLHVSSRAEMEFLKSHKKYVSVETLPQYLVFSAPEIYKRLGTLAQMNPPIRSAEHQKAIWEGIANGTVDILGTDHAPHTREEKAKPYPESPSGMPGVQTLVPVMLDMVNQGKLSLEKFCDLASTNPAKIFGIRGKGAIAIGNDADFTVVDMKKSAQVTDAAMATKCGWTPYNGMTLQGWPVGTVIRGQTVMWEGRLEGKPLGARLRFDETEG